MSTRRACTSTMSASASEELYAVADFCLIPMGTPSTSVGPYIAQCQTVLEEFKQQGLKYEMHGYGTNLEGPWNLVSKAIHDCHAAVHSMGAPRIATDIRIGTRTDKLPGQSSAAKTSEGDDQSWRQGLSENEQKRESVRRILAQKGTAQ